MRRSSNKAKGSKQATKRVQAVERGRKGKAAEGVREITTAQIIDKRVWAMWVDLQCKIGQIIKINGQKHQLIDVTQGPLFGGFTITATKLPPRKTRRLAKR